MSGVTTSYVTFAPTAISAFRFQAQCDGQQYNFFCPWNTFGQRWYIQCTDTNNNLIFYEPIIASGNTIFPLTTISWSYANNGTAVATTQLPHGFPLGSQPTLILSSNVPVTYNGTFLCDVLTPTMFSYPLTTYPGPLTTLGSAADVVNLLAGYFQTTRITYQTLLGQFQIDQGVQIVT